jgi:hypothetical protein
MTSGPAKGIFSRFERSKGGLLKLFKAAAAYVFAIDTPAALHVFKPGASLPGTVCKVIPIFTRGFRGEVLEAFSAHGKAFMISAGLGVSPFLLAACVPRLHGCALVARSGATTQATFQAWACPNRPCLSVSIAQHPKTVSHKSVSTF